jgi:oligopeptidase B
MNNTATSPPICTVKAKELSQHNDVRQDPYYWLNDRNDPEVIDYLKEENSYTESVTAGGSEFRSELFEEMKGRIKEDDSSVPYLLRGYWYYSRFEKGFEYPLYCRKEGSLEMSEEVILNVNDLAKGHSYFDLGGLSISPSNKIIAFGVDKISRRIYTIHFKDLETGEISKTEIQNTTGGCVWANDNKTVFYSSKDSQTLRSDKIHRFNIENGQGIEVYHESDEAFYTSVSKSKSRQYIQIVSSSSLTTEYRFLNADTPEGNFTTFHPRERGLEYGIAHYADVWYVVTNYNAINFRLMKCTVDETDKSSWEEVIAHRDDVLLEGIELFDDYLVVEERREGLTHMVIKQFSTNRSFELPIDDNCYTLGGGANPEFNTNILRYSYSSLKTPSSSYDYNMETGDRTLLKQQEIVGGYNRDEYDSERLFVVARDGKKVPVSMVYRKGFEKNGKQPLLLYGYGSYGHSMDPMFSSFRLSLLDRGFAFAIAHIRGGEELGRKWYDDGKLLNKKNTFNDFIDCAKYLVSENYTSENHLYAMGGSAGGLLMGAIANMEPSLFNGVVAAVPFVDVVTTMLDETIPLTTGEFDEWGNPKDQKYYEYIKSYSPYDNVESKDYPNMLVTTGLHDSQVQYWEPAKWVAKLRAVKTDQNVLLLKTEMDFGHGGASGRFERLKEIALDYYFILDLENITK